MDAQTLLRQNVEFAQMLVHAYLDDLSDSDWVVRSVPGTNHIAWQLGHLIAGTHMMLTALGCSTPALPAGFAEAHSKEAAAIDDRSRFPSRQQYLALMEQFKAAALAAIDATPAEKMDQPGPESMREYAPTVGAALSVLATHWLMHVGQWVPIRRKLGKAPLF